MTGCFYGLATLPGQKTFGYQPVLTVAGVKTSPSSTARCMYQIALAYLGARVDTSIAHSAVSHAIGVADQHEAHAHLK